MPRIWPALLVLLLSAGLAADDKPQTPAEKLAAIQKDVKDAEDAFRKAYAEAKDPKPDDKDLNDLSKAFNKKQDEGLAAAVEIARADPKSDAGFAALEWVLTVPRSYYLPAGVPAMELAAEHHAANPKVGKIVAWLGYFAPHEKYNPKEYAAARKLIEAVAEKNPDKTARAQAHLALALERRKKFSAAAYQKAPDAEKLAAEAEAAYEAVIKEYGDSPRLTREGAGTVGEFANSELFELRHLRIGKVAPDIEGEDLDGVKFKLSDYRGKVVLLDFWGDW
jgi:hypothetical protein